MERVWGWIQDEEHEENALVALFDGEIVGFAHHRMYARPAEGGTGLFLDDLFTAAARARPRRRTGADQRLADMARERGAAKVRWVTAADNATAQRLYDDIAERTDWVTYDLLV